MVAYWEEDWYRGLVLERRAQGALVKFIDYGNEDEVGDAMLRAAAPAERAVPPLALPCRLVGDTAAWRGALEAAEYQVSLRSVLGSPRLCCLPWEASLIQKPRWSCSA